MGQLSFRRTLLVFVGLQLGQVMSSIDGTIVATALPTIAGDIGGFSRSTWLVTAYALAMVASAGHDLGGGYEGHDAVWQVVVDAGGSCGRRAGVP